MAKFFHMVLNLVLVVIDHAASDEDKRIENKPPLSYDPSVEWSATKWCFPLIGWKINPASYIVILQQAI